jgi:hypothetical protein
MQIVFVLDVFAGLAFVVLAFVVLAFVVLAFVVLAFVVFATIMPTDFRPSFKSRMDYFLYSLDSCLIL